MGPNHLCSVLRGAKLVHHPTSLKLKGGGATPNDIPIVIPHLSRKL